MPKTVTLNQIGWLIAGEAVLVCWDNDRGTINMSPEKIRLGKLNRSTIKACINDAQFGCQYIESALVDVYELYATGYKIFRATLEFTKEDGELGDCTVLETVGAKL